MVHGGGFEHNWTDLSVGHVYRISHSSLSRHSPAGHRCGTGWRFVVYYRKRYRADHDYRVDYGFCGSHAYCPTRCYRGGTRRRAMVYGVWLRKDRPDHDWRFDYRASYSD